MSCSVAVIGCVLMGSVRFRGIQLSIGFAEFFSRSSSAKRRRIWSVSRRWRRRRRKCRAPTTCRPTRSSTTPPTPSRSSECTWGSSTSWSTNWRAWRWWWWLHFSVWKFLINFVLRQGGCVIRRVVVLVLVESYLVVLKLFLSPATWNFLQGWPVTLMMMELNESRFELLMNCFEEKVIFTF